MVEDCPFGYGMCWQIDELLTLYAFDLRNTEGVHEPLLSERYRSVSSKPTYFDFITDHIITHGEANHRDGWTSLHLHKHATLWRYPVKRHHVQPIQRWIARRMIEAVIHLHAHTRVCINRHAHACRVSLYGVVDVHLQASAYMYRVKVRSSEYPLSQIATAHISHIRGYLG